MPILPGITPAADYYLEADPETGRVRLRASDGMLLALFDASTPQGGNLLGLMISGLILVAPESSLYDLSLRRYINDLPEPKDADAAKPADPA